MKFLREFLQTEQAESDVRIYYECRHCGTELDSYVDECPACGRTEVATYTFEGFEGDNGYPP